MLGTFVLILLALGTFKLPKVRRRLARAKLKKSLRVINGG